jgi:threonine/homoserine/homoserine lactone efflux protein
MHSNPSVIRLLKSSSSGRQASRGIVHARLFGLAMLLSFLGSLPPGTTNLLTVQLVAEKGLTVAVLFATGCLLAELVTVASSLFLVDRMIRFKGVMRFLQWISLFVLLALAIGSFFAAAGKSTVQIGSTWDGSSPLVFGFALMIVNPVQFPFWLGWTTVLVEKRILHTGCVHYCLYVLGSGVGSMLASICFILLGRMLVAHWFTVPGLFPAILGTLFLVSFILQLRKMIVHRLLVKH